MAVDATARAQVLIEALPYIRRFHGRIVVIKLGGKAIEERKEETLLDVVLLRYVGMLPVIVHGGGSEITALSEKLGLQARFENGLRVTDEATMDVAKMVLTGRINPDLVGTINRLGGQAVGMSGEDGPSIIAEQLDPSLGLVGRVVQINPEPITALLSRGYVPVIASIGLGYDGQAYNINADTVAAELAVALEATKLLLVTDVAGVLDGNGKLLSEITRDQAAALVGEGSVSGGMIPKVEAGLRALDGVEQAHIIDGRQPHSLLLELFTESGVGTMVTA
ncbi:MAG: acetylglutamate kinase [Candidatus Dormibacteraeota bacterium]|nr:acetylglutamate kinase [Candidatus Dormibacteraeota bacterium]